VSRFLISTTIETLKVLRSIVEEDAPIDVDQMRQVRSNVNMLLGAYEGMKAGVGAGPEAPETFRLPDTFVRVGNDVINMALVERIRIDPRGQPAGRVQVDFSKDALNYSGESADLVRALLLGEPAPAPAGPETTRRRPSWLTRTPGPQQLWAEDDLVPRSDRERASVAWARLFGVRLEHVRRLDSFEDGDTLYNLFPGGRIHVQAPDGDRILVTAESPDALLLPTE
jgi:hypothetical protein